MSQPQITQKPEVGRSLSKSIIIGLLLGGLFLASILIWPEAFVVLAAAAAGAGAWELSTALRTKSWYVPRVPATVGSVLLMPVTYIWGAEGQWLAALTIVAALILWRTGMLFFGQPGNERSLSSAIKDFAAAAFLVIYVPLMTSFTVLILHALPLGQWWVVTTITTVSFIDTFGYLVGRKLGKHKLAPGVSPKKTWEGLLASVSAGSLVAISGSILLGKPWWFAVLFAGAMLLAAVFGDLAESLIKRDLGIKDMSSWLPGHGGIMDRLDSILPASLIAYLLISLPI
ncbi:MAG: phosphatidate cytidylyltransferase [Micrococcales bacterium]